MNDDMRHAAENPPPDADYRLSNQRLTSLARIVDPRLHSHRTALLVGLASAAFAVAANFDNGPV